MSWRAPTHRRLDEVAVVSGAAAASHHRRALLDTALDVTTHALHLLLGHQRPELARRIESGAKLHLAGDIREVLDDAIEQFFLHVQARPRRADLALVEKDRLRGACRSLRGVGVVQHNYRRLAAQLQ